MTDILLQEDITWIVTLTSLSLLITCVFNMPCMPFTIENEKSLSKYQIKVKGNS